MPPAETVRGGATPGQGLASHSADLEEILGLYPQEGWGKQQSQEVTRKGQSSLSHHEAQPA